MRLADVTEENFDAVIGLAVRPDQPDLVAPVVKSLAEAWLHREVAWPRVVCEGERPVAFVMAFLDLDWPGGGGKRSGLWRLTVDAAEQGKGYGRFAVEAVCGELRGRGETRAYVTFEPRDGGPRPFYEKLGFRLTGEWSEGELVAVREL